MHHLPPELIELIVDYLHGDKAALKACSLTSRTFLPRSQACLFETIAMRFPKMKGIQAHDSSDPYRVLLYTRHLSISHDLLIKLHDLDEIFDVFVAFKNIRKLQLAPFAIDTVNPDLALASRCFAHLRPTLRSLYLAVPTANPKGLVAFIAFFPFLERVSLFFLPSGGSVAGSELGKIDPNRLNPLRGTLQVSGYARGDELIQELAKVRVQYHTLELLPYPTLSWMGSQALIAACAPTLQVLHLARQGTPFPSYWWWVINSTLKLEILAADELHLGLRINLSPCTRLAEVWLYPELDGFSRYIELFSALLSTISSPEFHVVRLSFRRGVSTDNLAQDLVHLEEWDRLEEVLLKLSRESRNALEVFIILSDDVQSLPRCDGFMPRFREVGKVRFDFA